MFSIKDIKLILIVIYSLLILFFLFCYFYFDFGQYLNLQYLIENKDLFIKYQNDNIFLLSIFFFIFAILWILLQGFGTPLIILAGFLFSTTLGSALLISSNVIGCTLVYIIANSIFSESIQKNYSNYYKKLKKRLDDNEFVYYMILRIVPGIPVQTLNVLPVLFKMKIKFFFLATLIASAIPKIIYINLVNSFASSIIHDPINSKIFTSEESLIAIFLFLVCIISLNYIKKKYYKTEVKL